MVLKPRHGAKGVGVHVDLKDEDGLLQACADPGVLTGGAVVERYIVGEDHRLLVVGGKFVAAARRIPAQVIGDGRSTIRALVKTENLNPNRGMRFETLMEHIVLDDEAMALLSEAGLEPDSVPDEGQVIRLSGAANVSRGGSCVDVTGTIHPDTIDMAERAARLVGLDVVGIDFMTPDITQSWRDVACAILELNATPGLRPHLIANKDHDVAGAIVDYLFPSSAAAKIPRIGITGSLGKTTTCRMVASILSDTGRTVALSSTTGASVGDFDIRSDDVAGGMMATRLLQDPTVEAGVFELSRGGLIRSGLVLDTLTVGAVLNVGDNHLGQDGVNTREGLAQAKSIVARSTDELLVVNADDPLCIAMLKVARARRFCLVTLDSSNQFVQRHVDQGGLAVLVTAASPSDAPSITVRAGGKVIGTLPGEDLPASLGGKFRPPILNAAFAAGISSGLGIPFDQIRESLMKFRLTAENNRGRMNAFNGLPGQIYVTWGDGPIAAAEIAQFASRLTVTGRKRIFLSAAGNRRDDFIKNAAKAVAGAFDHYICSDWKDRRGREPGEIPGIQADALVENGVDPDSVVRFSSPDEAFDHCLASHNENDLLLFVTYEHDHIWSRLEAESGGNT